jgi:hypothetical protein
VAQRQVNIRLAEEAVTILEVAAFLDKETLPDRVRAVLMQHVESLRADPLVQEGLRLRAEREGMKEGSVTSLSARRTSKGEAGGGAAS